LKQTFFKTHLRDLGFSVNDNSSFYRHNIVVSNSEFGTSEVPIVFYYIPKTFLFNDLVFDLHEKLWNNNELPNFIITSDEESFIFDTKIKPNKENPFYAQIGQKTTHSSTSEYPFSKHNIDSGYFFDFVRKQTNKKKQQQVDKDLLLNLIALRRDLAEISDEDETIHLLILRCLFLKYLEDRKIYENGYVERILANTTTLLDAFGEVAKINGDIFNDDSIDKNKIQDAYLAKVRLFFTSDYRSGQGRLFPYKFDCIPVQLISHIYEAFLSESQKQSSGIYYTPKFVVDFMLSQTFLPVLKSNAAATIFDPACGSAAFLVEGYKLIIQRNKAQKDFDKKRKILVNQVFGIDIDSDALKIATFSLYLTLLEDLEPDFIKYQIENQSPILPSLIGKNLLYGNTISNMTLFEDKKFDCIIANPPWGNVDNETEDEKAERKAIGDKKKGGTNLTYASVADFQRSQAFLLRVKDWSNEKTQFGLIVNNSNFFNEKAYDFRQQFLQKYQLNSFYELSKINKILFKKHEIGIIKGKKIEIGASEPCAFLSFSNAKNNADNTVKYIVPKLTPLAEALHLIQITERDVKPIKQTILAKNDALWKIFVNGNWDDFELITKIRNQADKKIKVTCNRGFEAKKDAKLLGEPIYKQIITAPDFEQYFVKEKLNNYNFNVEQRERGGGKNIDLYKGERILMSYLPVPKDKLKLRCIYVQEEFINKHDVLIFKGLGLTYKIFLPILNSSLIGYYLTSISSQWQTGKNREVLRISDIVNLPFPTFNPNDEKVIKIEKLVDTIQDAKKEGKETDDLEKEIDELVFDLYGLLTYEKAIIKEFYDINVHRKNDSVRNSDIIAYFEKFKQVFELALSDSVSLKATYKVSPNLGAYLCFRLVDKIANQEPAIQVSNISDDEVYHAIKAEQLENTFNSNRLNEMTTKVYQEERFFIIKSNYFKDWTINQAIKDANAEIKTMTQETAVHLNG
jgi:hypothetical protein